MGVYCVAQIVLNSTPVAGVSCDNWKLWRNKNGTEKGFKFQKNDNV